jgi:Family of unknown function (DUF6510)
MDDVFVDGNALGGTLRTLFAVELTDAVGQCANCGRRRVLAEARVYARAPGLVARCVTCEAVLLRLVSGPQRTWIDMSGLAVIEIPSALTT